MANPGGERTISVELRDMTHMPTDPRSTVGTGTVSPLSGSPTPSEIQQARHTWAERESHLSNASTTFNEGNQWTSPVPHTAVPNLSNTGGGMSGNRSAFETNPQQTQSNNSWNKRQIAAVATGVVFGFVAVGATAGLSVAYSECAKANKELNDHPPTVTETVTHTKTVIDGDFCRDAITVTPTPITSDLANRSDMSDWSTPTDTTCSIDKR